MMRTVFAVSPDMPRLFLLVAVLVMATVLGLVWQRRSGRARLQSPQAPGLDAGLLAGLGVTAGGVTLLQFSSAFCQPCRATRRILGDVAARVPGVHHIDVDAESHLDAVRTLGIMRTPTTLVLDAEGRVRNRVVGQPRTADVLSALAPLVETPIPAGEKAASDD
ncbi:MAG: thioredoxin family protein [Mycobacteriales bacterium]